MARDAIDVALRITEQNSEKKDVPVTAVCDIFRNLGKKKPEKVGQGCLLCQGNENYLVTADTVIGEVEPYIQYDVTFTKKNLKEKRFSLKDIKMKVKYNSGLAIFFIDLNSPGLQHGTKTCSIFKSPLTITALDESKQQFCYIDKRRHNLTVSNDSTFIKFPDHAAQPNGLVILQSASNSTNKDVDVVGIQSQKRIIWSHEIQGSLAAPITACDPSSPNKDGQQSLAGAAAAADQTQNLVLNNGTAAGSVSHTSSTDNEDYTTPATGDADHNYSQRIERASWLGGINSGFPEQESSSTNGSMKDNEDPADDTAHATGMLVLSAQPINNIWRSGRSNNIEQINLLRGQVDELTGMLKRLERRLNYLLKSRARQEVLLTNLATLYQDQQTQIDKLRGQVNELTGMETPFQGLTKRDVGRKCPAHNEHLEERQLQDHNEKECPRAEIKRAFNVVDCLFERTSPAVSGEEAQEQAGQEVLLTNLPTLRQDQQTQVDQLRGQVNELTGAVERLERRQDDFQIRLEKPFQEHTNRDAGRGNNERLDVRQMPDHNETEVEELESRFNFASSSSETPRPTMSEDRTPPLEFRALNGYQAGSEQLQAEIDGLRGHVNELLGICKQKQTEIDEWRGICVQKQTEIDEWRGICKQKQTEIDEWRGSCEQKQTEINEWRGSCEQKQTEIDGLRETVDELTGSCQQEQTEIEELRDHSNGLD